MNGCGGFGLPGEPRAGAHGLSGPSPVVPPGLDGLHPPWITIADISLTGNKPKGGNFGASWPLAKEAHSHRLGQNGVRPKDG